MTHHPRFTKDKTRKFVRAECSCGWTSPWQPANGYSHWRCARTWQNHEEDAA